MTMSSMAPTKSVGDFITRRVMAFLRECGCELSKVIIKTDQEPATLSMVGDLVKLRVDRGAAETVPGAEDAKSFFLSKIHGQGGDAIYCTVEAYDDTGTGNTSTATTIIVDNTLPSVADVDITPDPGFYNTDLTCGYTFIDPDNDGDTSSIIWKVNNVQAGTGALFPVAQGCVEDADSLVLCFFHFYLV